MAERPGFSWISCFWCGCGSNRRRFSCGSKSPAISHVHVMPFWPCKSPKPPVFHDFSLCFWLVVMKNVKTSMLLKASHANAMRIWSWSRRSREPKPSSAWMSHCLCPCPLPLAPCKRPVAPIPAPLPRPKDDFEHEISTTEKPRHVQKGKYVSIFRISIFLRWFCWKSYKNARLLAFPT